MTATPVDYSASLELIAQTDCEVGEGPFWQAGRQELSFVESFGGTFYRYTPATGALFQHRVGKQMGTALPRARGGYVGASVEGLIAFDAEGRNEHLLVPVEQDRPGNRMNDAKCDSRGRLWVGTFATVFEKDSGMLYRIDPDHTVTPAWPGVYVANGIDWSPDEKRMYFNDTGKRLVQMFDYDIERGTVSNLRSLVHLERGEGLPDGLCVDAEGCLWLAVYGGRMVRRYSPEGEWLGAVHLPVAAVTSCCFGGPDLRDLYITTAWHEPKWVQPKSTRPPAGALFRCRPGVPGRPMHPYGG